MAITKFDFQEVVSYNPITNKLEIWDSVAQYVFKSDWSTIYIGLL
jgi:hypothetical protein